jgi:cold shock CspA family protein
MAHQEQDQAVKRGTVKWFNDAKGYGFIVHDDGRDVFVHYSTIEATGFRTLDQGELVEYEATPTPKGLLAARVRRLT